MSLERVLINQILGKDTLNLITPEEAAELMSRRAGYRITPEDIKQLRHHGRIRAAKQLSRTTLYEKEEIEKAPIPKKHKPIILPEEEIYIHTNNITNQTDEIGKSINNITTWRELLGQIISNPNERQIIADALDVNPITLIRWAANKSSPRLENLYTLLDIFPKYRSLFLKFILQEYPHFAHRALLTSNASGEIPLKFYTHIIECLTTLPPTMRMHSIMDLILEEISTHFDFYKLGLNVTITRCVPPSTGNMVRSLHKIMSKGTPPLNNDEYQGRFFGAESQIGQAIIDRAPIIIHSYEKKKKLFPADSTPLEESAVAYPIFLANGVAGCLYIASTQKEYFSRANHMALIRNYTNLLAMAFDREDTYYPRNIELDIMPSPKTQSRFLKAFQQRVIDKVLQATRDNTNFTRLDAELVVLQELEQELIGIHRS